jgi:surface polysaccharide O-acyltransferase-like enzyme
MKNTQTLQARWLALLAAKVIGVYLCWLMPKPFVVVLALDCCGHYLLSHTQTASQRHQKLVALRGVIFARGRRLILVPFVLVGQFIKLKTAGW